MSRGAVNAIEKRVLKIEASSRIRHGRRDKYRLNTEAGTCYFSRSMRLLGGRLLGGRCLAVDAFGAPVFGSTTMLPREQRR